MAPTEIDEALASHPEVVEAAAFALPHPTLGEDVAAAVVLRTPGAVTEDALREFVRGSLAAYKVPTRIVALDELPRGSFGKVRRGELATLAANSLRTEFVAPRNDEEGKVVRIFADVLGLERVGIFGNFFQLGGDSLRGARAVAQAQMVFDSPVALAALFREPTAAGFTAAIRDARSRPEVAAPPSIIAIPRRGTMEKDLLEPFPPAAPG